MLKNKLKNQVFLIYLVSRVIILFTPTLGNHPEFIDVILQILAGQNPYTSPGAIYVTFPPFHYLIYAFFVLIFGPTNFAFKTCTFVFDIGTVFLVYKIAKLIGDYEGREWMPALYFAFFPTSLILVFESMASVNSVFFFTLAIYFFLKKRFFWMGLLVGLGMLIEIFPIFLIYMTSIVFFARRQFKNLFQSLLGFACSYLCITVPFFGANIFDVILLQLTRQSTGLSLLAWLPEWTVHLTPSVDLNIFALLIVCIILALGIWIYFFTRHNELTEKMQVQIFLLLYLLLPILFLNVYDRYFLWVLPLMLILIKFPKDEKVVKRTFLLQSLVLIPAVIAIFLIYPNAMFENLQDFVCGNVGYPPCPIMISYNYLKLVVFASDPPLNWALFVYFLLFIMLCVIWMKRWQAGMKFSLIIQRDRIYHYFLRVFLFAGLVSNGGLMMILNPNLPNWLAPFLLFSGTATTLIFLLFGIILFYSNSIRAKTNGIKDFYSK